MLLPPSLWLRFIASAWVVRAQVTPVASFTKDLGLDSLDQVEVCMALEEEFCITIPGVCVCEGLQHSADTRVVQSRHVFTLALRSDAEAEKIQSNADAIEFIVAHPQAK